MNRASKPNRPQWIYLKIFLILIVINLFFIGAVFPLSREYLMFLGLFFGLPTLVCSLIVFWMIKQKVGFLVYGSTVVGLLIGILLGIYSLQNPHGLVAGVSILFGILLRFISGCTHECTGLILFLPVSFIFSFTLLGLFVGLVIKRWMRAAHGL